MMFDLIEPLNLFCMQAKSLKMVHPDSQWLYLITDTGTHSSINITSFVHLLDEGENIAFMYNITNEVFCQVIRFYVCEFFL